jgi:hypothetical protein
MILPTKSLRPEMALLAIGADILGQLHHAMPVSEVWNRVLAADKERTPSRIQSFDWFVSALTLLYAISAISYSDGLIRRGA